VIGGKNVLVWKLSNGSLWQWEYDSTWKNLQRGFGSSAPNTALYYATESQFGVDIDEDTFVGSPLNPIEGVGIGLGYHKATGALYAGNTLIEYQGNPLVYQTWVNRGWTAVAADVIGGKNVLVWRLSNGNLWQWEYDSTWKNLQRGFGSSAPNTAAFYSTEVQFGVSFDSDGIVGSPPLTLDSAGSVTLATNIAGNLTANSTELKFNGSPIRFDTWLSRGWTSVAADVIGGKNVLVWRLANGNLWQWEYDSTWSTVLRGFGSTRAGTAEFYQLEQDFGVDLDGVNGIGA
jgi:hypothetical protein